MTDFFFGWTDKRNRWILYLILSICQNSIELSGRHAQHSNIAYRYSTLWHNISGKQLKHIFLFLYSIYRSVGRSVGWWCWFLEPTAMILGGPDLFVSKGSTLNLTCTIRFGPEPPGYIFWYHENKVSISTCIYRTHFSLYIPFAIYIRVILLSNVIHSHFVIFIYLV